MVSARIHGKVVEVLVRDNQPVKTGDPLLLIDPEPFAVREVRGRFRRRRGSRRTSPPRGPTSSPPVPT